MSSFSNHWPMALMGLVCLSIGVGLELILSLSSGLSLHTVAVGMVALSTVVFAVPHLLLFSTPEQFPQP